MLFKLDHFSRIRGGNWKMFETTKQFIFPNKKNLCESFISQKMGFSKWHRHISQANLLPYSCNSNPSKGQVKTRCTDELQEKTIRTLPTGSFTRFRCFRLSGAPGVEVFVVVVCSPPVRWGLLDFMSDSSPPSLLLLLLLLRRRPLVLRRPPQLTGILCVQCGVLDRNGNWDLSVPVWRAGPQMQLHSLSSVWRAGLQPRCCEFSVACWTPTAILRVQCGVLDPNRDIACSVWRAGPQPRSCEFSVASRTPTAILWVQCGVPDLTYCVRKFVRKNDRRYVRKNDRRYVRRNVKKICQKICQKECQKICQKICQKECQKICQKECQTICQKEW